jgi:hypothetical protein
MTTSAHAQSFDGMYQPEGNDWTCNPDHIGMDGGALAIGGGFIDGVENRCELINPRQSTTGDGTQYTALCSGEGEEYREDLTIASTNDGVRILRDEYEILWTRCGGSHASTNNETTGGGSNAQWKYANKTAFSLSGDNYFALSCETFNTSST